MSNKQDSFPRSLLKDTVAARLQYFKGFIAAHAVMSEVYKQVEDSLESTHPLVMVVGPTGVGKTTLLNTLSDNMRSADGRLPFVRVTAKPRNSQKFSWREFYAECLAALKDPVPGKKKIYPEDTSIRRNLDLTGLTGNEIFRCALEKLLAERRPQALIIDEIQHVAVRQGNTTVAEQLDCFKDMADRTKVKHIFFGTYKCADFFAQNDNEQPLRRMKTIEFRRYRSEIEGDIDLYGKLLRTFQAQMPIQSKLVFEKNLDRFYGLTMGCGGLLHTLLFEALRLALKEDSGRNSQLKEDHLKAAEPRINDMKKIVKITAEGEQRFGENAGDTIDSLLEILHYEVGVEKREKPGKRKKRRVGQRKPGRDYIT